MGSDGIWNYGKFRFFVAISRACGCVSQQWQCVGKVEKPFGGLGVSSLSSKKEDIKTCNLDIPTKC